MPCRISESCSTSTVSNGTPRWSRMATARLEKPHCGNRTVPFMNRTTSFLLTISSMRSRTAVMTWLLHSLGCGGGELERVQLGAHPSAQRFVDALMLLDARQPPEALGDHPRFIMVAVAGQV